MKNLLAILAVVLLGTIFANAQTQNVYVDVTCDAVSVLSTGGSGIGATGAGVTVVAGATAFSIGNLTWDIKGDGTDKTSWSGTPTYTAADGFGCSLSVGTATGTIAAHCNATGTVTAAATVTVDLTAKSGEHTWVVTLSSVN